MMMLPLIHPNMKDPQMQLYKLPLLNLKHPLRLMLDNKHPQQLKLIIQPHPQLPLDIK
jgi:hypothetical protein